MADMMMAEAEYGAHVPFLGYKREETKHLGASYNSFEAGEWAVGVCAFVCVCVCVCAFDFGYGPGRAWRDTCAEDK